VSLDILPGDELVAADGQPIAAESPDELDLALAGAPKSSVQLEFLRRRLDGSLVRLQRTVRRERVDEESAVPVAIMLDSATGYVRVTTFEGDKVADDLHSALGKLEDRGMHALVLDLRGNGGGLLDEAVLNASIFLPKGEVVVTTNSRTQGHAVYKTKGDNLPPMPIVVLIDRNTASAAEILTAALADDAGAKTVGTRSYGKGVFQQEIGLSNGGALKLTVGEYFTPNGENLAGKGIHPDVKARDLPGTPRDEGLEKALEVLAAEAR
jgi:carboxyl-terminal processing protease